MRDEICLYWLDCVGEFDCFVVQDTKPGSRDGFIVVGKRYDAGVFDGYRDLFSWHGDGGSLLSLLRVLIQGAKSENEEKDKEGDKEGEKADQKAGEN